MNIPQIQLAAASHANPLEELDQIEAAIDVSTRWLSTLQARRVALTDHLDEITQPEVPVSSLLPGTAAVAKAPPKLFVGPGFAYRGQHSRHWSAIDIYVALLRRLWADMPERREAMAAALASRGTSRCYVAKTCAALFGNQSQTFANRHSRVLTDGWVVDTNLNRARIRTLSVVAVQAAGLRWNEDVKVYWRTTLLEP